MLRVFKTVGGRLAEIDDELRDDAEKNYWLSLVSPTDAELQRVAAYSAVPIDFLRAALDDEERPRLEFEDGQALLIVSIPVVRGDEIDRYDTIPLGIALSHDVVVTVCLEPNELIESLSATRPRAIHTGKRTRFLLQLLFRIATLYLRYLRQIDKKTDAIERALHRSLRNEDLIELFDLEKGLVYFTTSLRSNQIVMEKLLRSRLRRESNDEQAVLKLYPEDEDLLEDVITENKQAIEMAEVYSNILTGMLGAFASVVSNNLNAVMKFLTSVTIVLALPTMVASFFGMNVSIPYQHSPHAFLLTMLISFVLAAAAIVLLMRRRMF